VTNSNANYVAETVATRPTMTDDRHDLPALMRRIRVCRATLGAILDELECGDRSPAVVEKLAECTTNVAGEIEDFWETIKRSPEPLENAS
jgi:hypothetical protein